MSAVPVVPAAPAPVGSASLRSAAASSSSRVAAGTAASSRRSRPRVSTTGRRPWRHGSACRSCPWRAGSPTPGPPPPATTATAPRAHPGGSPANARVTTAGRESGTAATARATAATAVISHGCPRTSPDTRKTRRDHDADGDLPAEPVEPALQRVAGDPLLHERGHAPDSAPRAGGDDDGLAGTRTTELPAWTMPSRSATGPSSGATASADRSAGRDSPVNSDSSTWRRVLRSSPRVGADEVPGGQPQDVPSDQVPGGHQTSRAERTTRAFGATRVVSARTALIALRSWRTPSVVLTVMTSTITAQSTRSPVSAVSTAAPISTRIKMSVSWASTERSSDAAAGSPPRWAVRCQPCRRDRIVQAGARVDAQLFGDVGRRPGPGHARADRSRRAVRAGCGGGPAGRRSLPPSQPRCPRPCAPGHEVLHRPDSVPRPDRFGDVLRRAWILIRTSSATLPWR